MVWSDLVKQLTAGFDLHTNRDKKYGPVYHDGRPIAEVQLLEYGTERIWLKEANAASGLFTLTRSSTWKGGYCVVTKETVAACRRALKLAAAESPPGVK
jgi:hypothetical protein